MANRTERNEPCRCGSGKKTKNCCGIRSTPFNLKPRSLLIGGVAVIALLAALFVVEGRDASTDPGTTNSTGLVPQPPGPAPPGKIWSAEHGHWHDAPALDPAALSVGQLPGQSASQLTPQPPGPVPEGKVWSAEHGHWHNADPSPTGVDPADEPGALIEGSLQQPARRNVPQPPGPVPEGKVWSPEHGHWHNAPAEEPESQGTEGGDGEERVGEGT